METVPIAIGINLDNRMNGAIIFSWNAEEHIGALHSNLAIYRIKVTMRVLNSYETPMPHTLRRHHK